ncbi:hypothetical protein H4R33_002464 [Dimargaris cristalligena]|uniref:Uncharacterized protein n=1 Tax=Dimargaris cristalligena TaxID=215637 RepID=A0A4P9ZS15_9FUNG|nr:hypothetical protein H4R33_002464 [Dimargaris cristalligena]RKP35462.1 hypothetical protein BJ085DRAFT_35325 [Dimargaris cristalligena]|eukprot:RKP35462.1 hypothetical protein BJ085DRAFT_35325 [Dimargaris cristalligena]
MDANIDYSHRTSFEKAFSMKDDKRNEVVPLNGSPPSFNCKLAKDLGKENVAKKPPASTNLVPVSLNSPASEVADQGTFHANPAAPFEPTVPDIVITDVDDHPSDLGTTSPIYSAQAVPQELPNNSFNESDGEAAPPNPSQDTPLPPAVAEVESEQRLPPTKPPRRNYLNKKNPVPVDVNSPPGPIQANQEGPTPRKENGSTSADFGTTSSNQSTYVDQKNDGKSSAWPDKNDTDWSEDDSQLTDDEFWEDVTSQFPAPPSVGRPHRAQFQPQLAVPI